MLKISWYLLRKSFSSCSCSSSGGLQLMQPSAGAGALYSLALEPRLIVAREYVGNHVLTNGTVHLQGGNHGKSWKAPGAISMHSFKMVVNDHTHPEANASQPHALPPTNAPYMLPKRGATHYHSCSTPPQHIGKQPATQTQLRTQSTTESTPRMHMRIRRLQSDGHIEVHQRCTLASAHFVEYVSPSHLHLTVAVWGASI